MKHLRFKVLVTMVAVLAVFGAATLAVANKGRENGSFYTVLTGFSEVPAISTTGGGEFTAIVSEESALHYELTYQNLEGTTTTAAHIHIGQPDVNGGVVVFLCGGGGRPPCTPTSGRFTGTITPADVLALPAQGIAAGEFDELLKMMRAGRTYANVHTNRHPGGEIRGDIPGTFK